MKASIIISVYKNVRALYAVLESLRDQTERDFEVVISEDGDIVEMEHAVANYPWFCEYQHLRQEDLGWRKNRALNRAIKSSRGEWLIFLDGDCVVDRRFVEEHLRSSGKDRVLLGKRVKMSKILSDSVLSGEVGVRDLPKKMWGYLFSSQGCRYVDEGVFLPMMLRKKSVRNLTGCNMSFSRATAEAINGFDEDYVLPAVGEDVDLTWRFRGVGKEIYSVRNRALCFHLHHKENWTDQSENMIKMAEKRRRGAYVCERGMGR